MGPPETKTVGTLTRAAAIIMPGTILSQLGMQTMPSKQWARSMVSTQSAMSSRRGEGIFHADVAHGDAVIDADGVEFEGHAAGLADGVADFLADDVEVGVAGDDLDEGVADGDEGLAHIGFGKAAGLEQGAVRGAFETFFDHVATHGGSPSSWFL